RQPVRRRRPRRQRLGVGRLGQRRRAGRHPRRQLVPQPPRRAQQQPRARRAGAAGSRHRPAHVRQRAERGRHPMIEEGVVVSLRRFPLEESRELAGDAVPPISSTEVLMSYSRKNWLLFWTLALTACAERGDGPSTSTDVAAVLDPYAGHQGRLLLGFGDPDVRTFTFPPTVINAHVAAIGQLV